jgi:hypothetical protein
VVSHSLLVGPSFQTVVSRSDYNFVRTNDGKCEPRGPEPVPEGVCKDGDKDETFMGSSGYRLIPGNTCDKSKGPKLDEPVKKSCSQAAPPEGKVRHQIFKFQSVVVQQEYFKKSQVSFAPPRSRSLNLLFDRPLSLDSLMGQSGSP